MTALSALADFRRADSPARRFRARRHELFRALLDRLPRPVRILDVGGTVTFWRTLGLQGEDGVSVTTLNLEVDPEDAVPGIEALQGDARDLSRFADRSFDVVFSNSLIEHVGGEEDQRRAAEEMRRVGRAYFVQTPNRWFPIEPHFLFPFFQFLPRSLQVYLLTHLSLGWCGKLGDRERARREAEGIELLTRRRVRAFFPEATIWNERFCGLVKSFVAYGGFPEARPRA